MNSSNPVRFVIGAALLLALTVAPTCGSAAAEPIAGLGTLTLDMTAAEVKVALDQRPAVVHEPAQGKNPERFRFGTRIDGRDYDVSARIHNGRLDNISLYLILPGMDMSEEVCVGHIEETLHLLKQHYGEPDIVRHGRRFGGEAFFVWERDHSHIVLWSIFKLSEKKCLLISVDYHNQPFDRGESIAMAETTKLPEA